MSQERTFIAVKPDGVQRGLVGEIIKRFEVKGFKLVALKFIQASEDHLKKHYADLSDKPFFAGLVKYMASGPLVAMCWEGPGVVKTARQMMGETKPADSKPGTIRGDFCIEVGRNIIHGSDSVESANKELSLWFKPEELVSWKQATHDWIYEMISLLSDLTTEEGLKALNEYLKDKSYMHGYCVSQSDITVFISIKQSLDPKLYPHLHRWHKHIKVVGGDITKPPNFIKHEGQECKILKENISYKSPKKEQAMKTDNSRTESQDSLVDNSDVVSEKELRNIKDDKDYDSQVYPTEISNIYTILLEIKPKDEEVDMKELESLVRGVDLEGLKWGASQTTPIAYGIHKLSIICTLEDDRSSMQDVLQRLVKYENYVRDVNIAAFNKL